MFLKSKTDWKLLAKYMAGETNIKEKEAVDAWSDKGQENRALLNDIKSDWKKMEKMNVRFDVDNAWNKVHNRIIVEDKPITSAAVELKQRPLYNYFSVPIRIAASFLLLAILGIALYTTAARFQKIEQFASADEKGKKIELPDGSVVYLNASAKLSYTKQFGRKSRVVKLEGEAFFEVTPDKTKPFRIFAGNACVKVLGTSFNVNSRENDNKVEVYVSTGIVELSEIDDEHNRILLHPGSIGLIDHHEINYAMAENANAIAWKTGALTFSDAPLIEVIALLNKVYNVNITVKGEGIDTIRINGSYQGDPLDHILKVIGQHNPQLNIAKSADTIYLSQ